MDIKLVITDLGMLQSFETIIGEIKAFSADLSARDILDFWKEINNDSNYNVDDPFQIVSILLHAQQQGILTVYLNDVELKPVHFKSTEGQPDTIQATTLFYHNFEMIPLSALIKA